MHLIPWIFKQPSKKENLLHTNILVLCGHQQYGNLQDHQTDLCLLRGFIKKLIITVDPSYFHGTAIVRVLRCISTEQNKKKYIPATKDIQLISFQTMKTQKLLDVIKIF